MIEGSSWQQLLAGTEPRGATGSEEASCNPVLLPQCTMRHGSNGSDTLSGGTEGMKLTAAARAKGRALTVVASWQHSQEVGLLPGVLVHLQRWRYTGLQ